MEFTDVMEADTICSICSAEFLDPDDLSIHVSQMHPKTPTKFRLCQFCPVYLCSLEDYALHIRDEHLINLKCCKYCNRVFTDFDEYRKHESHHYTYVAKSLYSCSQCQKLFNNISELESHEFQKHRDSTNGTYINECLPLLSSILNIKALKFLQSLGEEVSYLCVRCEMTTSEPQQYLDHLKTKGCRSYACDSCSSVYNYKRGLIKHIATHKECQVGTMQVYKQCKECFKMFDVRMWRDHTKNCKAIKCKTCNIVFTTMYDLSKHTTEAHPVTVTLVLCVYCNKEFAGQLSLEKHVERAHKEDAHLYKYVCVTCNAIFKHPKKLFAHFYSTHKELEPYTCKICDKKFKIRKKFTIHIKLDHKSIGYIEFDSNYHVYFSDKKSIKPTNEITQEDSNEMKSVALMPEKENINEITGPSKEYTVNENSKKVKFNIQNQQQSDSTSLNMNSDFMSATETEGNQTEGEKEKPLKRKLKMKAGIKKRFKKSADIIISDSSDNEPLEELRKRVQTNKKFRLRHATWNRKKRKDLKETKKKFICNICKKNCYTYQNYHNHVALHYKNVMLKCVKCSESFSSTENLKEHYSKEHSSSQLTDTLKNILEKRKKGIPINQEVSSTERFMRTIKKVDIPEVEEVKTTLREVSNKLSVQKFIESFTPEDTPKSKVIDIDCSISIKPYTGPCKEPLIKLTKCKLRHMEFTKTNLAMPVRYRQIVGETHTVTFKEVEFVEEPVQIESSRVQSEDETQFEDDNMDRSESIPDVAQEVMLEGSEDPAPKTLYIPHRVVLPKLPSEYKKIRIAHLQTEAPYYKIVKVEDVLNSQPDKPKIEEPVEQKKVDIKLPDGTKLVTVNPLAHLLGDTPVGKILENTKNKYYKPKSKDFEVAIAKAMLRLEKPESYPKKRRKRTNVN